MAKIFKNVFQRAIGPYQSAFIKGWMISDNYIIVYKVLYSFENQKKKKKGKRWWCLKLDMAKAYDRMEWDFLASILSVYGFHKDFIQIIMECVSSTLFSIFLNGSPFWDIQWPQTKWSEVLSNMLLKVGEEGWIHGIQSTRNAPSISHLLYANDNLLFCEVNFSEVCEIKDTLDD